VVRAELGATGPESLEAPDEHGRGVGKDERGGRVEEGDEAGTACGEQRVVQVVSEARTSEGAGVDEDDCWRSGEEGEGGTDSAGGGEVAAATRAVEQVHDWYL
jgi:hypothetical protein